MAALFACRNINSEDESVVPQQGITKIVIDTGNGNGNGETVSFGDTAFGAVGPYQKIPGVGYGQLDPNDPKNPVIADIAWAEKNPAAGRVAYSTDFFILKPNQLSKGNHKVFFEAPNCGGKVFTDFNDAACQG